MKILLTGSAGYIGSCLYEAIKNKYEIYGVDKVKPKIKKQKRFFLLNLLDKKRTDALIKFIKPDLIIHLAGQSTIDFIKKQNEYKKNNIKITNNLLDIIKTNNIKHLVFSSTAAVYKVSNKTLNEKSFLSPNNIYGKTKLQCEREIKKKLNKSITNFIIFRFFNVCSAMYEHRIGEFHEPETHLIPIIAEKLRSNKKFFIYGNNFKTTDKTCIRDYIHIKDIVDAFQKSIKYLKLNNQSRIINLGTNKGFSTLTIFQKFIKLYKENYSYPVPVYKKRRKGDISKLICDNKKSYRILKWKPKNSTISKIIRDEVNWLKYIYKKKYKRTTIY
jgi:UDP-glucose 4-epimerase